MNKIVFLYLASATLIFAACQPKADTASNIGDQKEEIQANLTEITEPGFEMALVLPQEFTSMNEPEIYYDDMVGILKIRVGDEVGIDILDQSLELEDYKKSLFNKKMFTYKFLDESADGFTFQSVLPDGEVYSSNFIQKFKLNDKEYYARSATNGEYSIEKVKKMKEIITSIKSI